MLMGLVTKNAILLVDFTNQLRAAGQDRAHAILEAGRRTSSGPGRPRMRSIPIAMRKALTRPALPATTGPAAPPAEAKRAM